MNKINHALQLAKQFCTTWFSDRDLEKTMSYLASDVLFTGTAEDETAQGTENIREYIRQDMMESKTPFVLDFDKEQEQSVSGGISFVALEFTMKNSDYEWHIHTTFTLSQEEDSCLIRQMHFAIPTSQQETGEHYPLTLVKSRINQVRQQLLSSNIAGGLMGGYLEDNFPFYYVNDRMLQYLGYTSEQEFVDDIGGYISNCMHPDDKEMVDQTVSQQLAVSNEYVVEYRMRKKDRSYIYVHDVGNVISAEDGRPAILSVCVDISNQKKAQQTIQRIYNNIPGAVFICKFDSDWTVTDANDHLFEFLGYTREEFSAMGNKMAAVIYPADLKVMTSVITNQLTDGRTTIENENRLICKDGTIKWISIKAQLLTDESGEQSFYCVFVDITNQKEIQRQLDMSENRLETAITHAGVQFWEYDLTNNRAYISDFSQKMYDVASVMENFPESFIALGYIHPDDVEIYRDIHRQLKAGAADIVKEYRVCLSGDEYCWMRLHYSTIFDEEQKPIRAIATAELIDDYKKMEEQFTIAIKQTGVKVWILDLQSRLLDYEDSNGEHYSLKVNLSDGPDDNFNVAHMIHPDDIALVWKKYSELFHDADNISFEARFTNDDGRYSWKKIFYTCIKAKNGTALRAIGTSIDINEQILLKERFDQELEYSTQLQTPNLITKVQCNISQNLIASYSADANNSLTETGALYSIALEGMAQSAFTPEQQNLIRTTLLREQILEDYDNGKNFYTLDYQRRLLDGSVIWTNATVKTYQNPASGDIMTFMYSFDINEQKITQEIVERVVDTNFDFLALFNVSPGRILRMIDKKEIPHNPKEGSQYETYVLSVLKEMLSPSDYEDNISKFKMSSIIKGLNEKGTYSLSFDIHEPGSPDLCHKLWTYNWFDGERTKILWTRRDITEINRQEQQQKEALAAALTAAKQASAAKSDFLSRMSHEIRTPMNAIIGMTAIAAQSFGKEEQLSDCISKIGISSRFLLSLINDILDMSRIESGKMLLKNEKIPFAEFVNGINTICHSQADAKGVDYECIVEPVVDDYYMGDAMKLQQVLVNILSNAVKFTGAGGKVTFSISQRKKTASDAMLRFIINDTGIGMSEEFLPHLFDPFEQESTGITAMYGGTGLGLAISKNIVDMMGGKITVRSIKGIGTEFTVDTKLGIIEGEQRHPAQKKPVYNFSHLKTLVVDDDVVVCESAVLTLKEIGITAEWVDSGQKAVDCVREKWQKKEYYHMILIDWKMPEMDGIETTRRVREIVGPDVTIIIMTAYDWRSIEYEAKAAGVNLLMSKPMFKSSLISAFSRALGEIEEKQNETPVEFNFSGKRVLLVEDHPMNVEVAKILLENKGFEVEVAENGLRAIELFSKTKTGYYDAILMDIRMPIMDGLQASANIRHLSNLDATTIPIIAMTANAFDDDVDKSKAAGMNAHLAKPIDPPRLYQTLYDFIYRKDSD